MWFQPTSPMVWLIPQSWKFALNCPAFSALTCATYASYRAVSDGKVRNTTAVIPGAGAVQVTIVAPCCLQLEGGSSPLAPPLWSASMIAAISALGGAGLALALAVIDGMVMAAARPPWPPLSPAQIPAPAAIRISAVSAAIQRGWRNHRRGAPARPAPAPGPGWLPPGGAPPAPDGSAGRRWETMVSPRCVSTACVTGAAVSAGWPASGAVARLPRAARAVS